MASVGQRMIKLLGTVPSSVCVAVSGGLDSMAALNFIRNNGKRKVVALHFNHGTEHGFDAEEFVSDYCNKKEIPLVSSRISRSIAKGESKEAYWRSERYNFFNNWISEGSFSDSAKTLLKDGSIDCFYRAPIVTCHHLNDAVETWIFTSLHGNPNLIPYKRGSFIRPFLLSTKDDLVNWALKKGVPYIVDPSNQDTSYMRNLIRLEIVPKAIKVNPGLNKVVKKKIISNFNKSVDII